MRQTRSRTKAQNLPADVPELEKAIDTLDQKELRQLLNYRSSDKSSLSRLRTRCYELLKSDYSPTKSRLQSILDKQTEIAASCSSLAQNFMLPASSDSQSLPHIIPALRSSGVVSPFQHPPLQPNNIPINPNLHQPPISTFLHQFEQFANNKNQQPTQALSRLPYYRPSPQPGLVSQQSTIRPTTDVPHNNGMMYQTNVNQQATGNGAILAHTNGMINSGYAPPQQQSIQSNMPAHPEVRLKKLAFFDEIASLLKPTTLIPSSSTQRMQEATFYFHLTPQQATDIANNRDIRNTSKIEHVVQVQLRFCLLETSSEQEDYFPANVVVKVNNKLCALPNPIPTNKPGVEPKRPPRPVNITSNVKLSPTVANNINVTWSADFNSRGFIVAANLVKKLTSSQLLQRIKTKDGSTHPSEHTRNLIREKLQEDADCDIATTELRVSLMCPLGKMRMSTPCRSKSCSHLQCFDASLYLQMNERKPTWNCPVCDKPATYENLVIDGYFQEVLSSSSLPSEINEITLLKDGSWATTADTQTEANTLDTPRKPNHKVEVISDDIEVIIADDSPNTSIKNESMNGGNNGSSKLNEPTSTTTGDSVDLTLSDSDDEVLPLRQNNNSNSTNPSNKIPSATPVITNDAIISLDSPSPPLSSVSTSAPTSTQTSAHTSTHPSTPTYTPSVPTFTPPAPPPPVRSDHTGYPNYNMPPPNTSIFDSMNSFGPHYYPGYTGAPQNTLERSDPLYLYKNNWLSQQLPSSTDWELLRSQHDDPNNQNQLGCNGFG